MIKFAETVTHLPDTPKKTPVDFSIEAIHTYPTPIWVLPGGQCGCTSFKGRQLVPPNITFKLQGTLSARSNSGIHKKKVWFTPYAGDTQFHGKNIKDIEQLDKRTEAFIQVNIV